MLEKLLTPQSVAVIGASRSPGKTGYEILSNLVKQGFGGTVVPVNPNGGEILGVPVYKDLNDYDGTVDMAVIVVPKPAVRPAIESAVRAGAKAVIVITAGFSEIGDEGEAEERALAQYCAGKRVRMMGPNCLGLINTHHKMNASFARLTPPTGDISVISQSGAICTAILDLAVRRNVGLGKVISIGNKADLNELDFLAALGKDPKTKVIIGYLERFASGDQFVRVAEAVSKNKPVILIKAGTTESGQRAAISHTGRAGAVVAHIAAFRRAGVIQADSFESLTDVAEAFARQPLPRGNRVAVVNNGGGPGTIAADAIELAGMQMAELSEATTQTLRDMLPPAAGIGNPIDIMGTAGPKRYADVVEVIMRDDAVDATIVILSPQAMTKPLETAVAVCERVDGMQKTLLPVFMGGEDVELGRQALKKHSLPAFPSPERAVSALRAMWTYYTWRERAPRVVTRFPVYRRRAQRIVDRQLRAGRSWISEAKSKELLRAYNFAVPDGRPALTSDEAVEVAEHVGYPVALKVMSPDIVNKADVGGVRLGLSDPEAVRDAFDLMMLRVSRRAPKAELDGAYVERMCPQGWEVILGMTRDPQFGPMLMFGLGGAFVEIMKDVAFQLAPITREEALQMMSSTRTYAMVKARGQTRDFDLDAVAAGLQRISQLATDIPEISELDLNPLIVGEFGAEPMVADARIALAQDASE